MPRLMRPRRPPYRSRAFLAWAKGQVGPCCLCAAPGVELHHFGDDGGTGQKPSDHAVARMCQACHAEHGRKGRDLVERMETLERRMG